MKVRELARDCADGFLVGVARGEQPMQHPALVEPPHPDREFLGVVLFARAAHRVAMVAPDDRNDTEVEVRREPPIEAHLVPAEFVAMSEFGGVEERKAHRLFDLVGEIAGQKDVRDMSLPEFDRVGPLGVKARFKHRADEAGQRAFDAVCCGVRCGLGPHLATSAGSTSLRFR